MWPGWYLFLIHLLAFWISVIRSLLIPRHQATLSVLEILPLVLLNQFFVTLNSIWFLISLDPAINLSENSISDFLLALLQYPVMLLTLNLGFALAHYSFHKIRWLYHNIHAIHHQLRVPHPIGAIYAHPVEHLLANLLPIGMAIWLVGAGWYLSLIFVAHVSFETVNGHAQYLEKELCSRHYLHHNILICNYDNSPYLFDKLMGTYR